MASIKNPETAHKVYTFLKKVNGLAKKLGFSKTEITPSMACSSYILLLDITGEFKMKITIPLNKSSLGCSVITLTPPKLIEDGIREMFGENKTLAIEINGNAFSDAVKLVKKASDLNFSNNIISFIGSSTSKDDEGEVEAILDCCKANLKEYTFINSNKLEEVLDPIEGLTKVEVEGSPTEEQLCFLTVSEEGDLSIKYDRASFIDKNNLLIISYHKKILPKMEVKDVITIRILETPPFLSRKDILTCNFIVKNKLYTYDFSFLFITKEELI